MAAALALSPAAAPLADCTIGWLVNTRTGECIAKPCGKWACSTCGPRNVRRLAARFRREGKRYNRFITLTLVGKFESTREALRVMSRGWRKLYFRLKREYGLLDFTWVHERGALHDRVHKHLVVNNPRFIPQRRLSRLAAECGLGRVVDVRAIKGEWGPRSYLTKYLVKSSARGDWPLHARRVQHSLSREPRRTEDRWIFQPRPRVPWLRRIEESPVLLPLAGELAPADPMLPFARSP